MLKLLDLADHVLVEGPAIRTKTGALAVSARRYEHLGKALLPPPAKWHGLKDVEKRYRERYVDLFANPAVAEVFRARSTIVQSLRRFLDDLRLPRGRNADAPCDSRRRDRQALRHASQRPRPRADPPHRARALSQTAARRRLRPRLRDRPHLSQRGHQHQAQSRIHDPRVLHGLRHVRGPDGPGGRHAPCRRRRSAHEVSRPRRRANV